jgi:hypothetical protein
VPDPEPEFKPAVPYEPLPAEESTGDEVFELLWNKVLSDWDDEKTHVALLEYSIQRERLPDAAGRYRALKDDPDKGKVAEKRLDAIVMAATQMMMSMKTPTNVKVPVSITLTVFMLFACAMLFIAYAVFHRH